MPYQWDGGGVNRNKGGLSKSTSFNYVLQTRKKKEIIKTELKHFRKKMRIVVVVVVVALLLLL